MFNKKELRKFLVDAKKSTYASGNLAKKIINSDKSTTLVFKDGDWEYNDNYFGGEPYGGREVVFFKKRPVYMMVYYGSIINSINNIKYIYNFLMDALKLISEDSPYRGPNKYNKGSLLYKNSFIGEIDNFFGEEIISESGNRIYSAKYIGGFVDIN